MALHFPALNWFTPVAMWEIYCEWSQNKCEINQRSGVDTEPLAPEIRLPTVDENNKHYDFNGTDDMGVSVEIVDSRVIVSIHCRMEPG